MGFASLYPSYAFDPFADVGKSMRFMIAMQHVEQTRTEMGSGIRLRRYTTG
jgi:hypothetical protein